MEVIVVFILGLLLGSFVNALVWRLHEQGAGYEDEDERPGVKLPSKDDLSIVRGRSMCPKCRHALAPNDLIPVFSWLFLKGKCRYCRKPISCQYPLVELTTAFLFVISYVFLPEVVVSNFLLLAIYYVLLTLGVALAVYDAKWFLLPNRLVYPFQAAVAVLVVGMAYLQHDFRLLVQAGLSSFLFYVVFRLIYEVSQGKWLGYGDVRLVVALGALAGSLPKVFLLLFGASLAGTLVSLPLLAKSNRRTARRHIPFGPFLLLAAFAVFMWGDWVVAWYRSYIGL